MEEHLTEDQRNILRSCLRRGLPLPEGDRDHFAKTVHALLKQSDVFVDTCQFLASECEADMAQYEAHLTDRWRDDAAEELLWWWGWTQKKRAEGTLHNWGAQKSARFPFEPYIDQFPDGPIRVLNIGSGPRSTMGEDSAAGDRLNFTHMDPLAKAYNKIMGLLNAPGTGDIVFGAVEFLSKLELPQYHVISATNCLDHAYDVPRGLDELVAKLERTGLIQLRHYENEAEAQNYLGFHQWNIEIKDDRIHVWTKDRSHLFDHAAHGLDLTVDRKDVRKGAGTVHPQITIILSRGLTI